MYKIHSEVSYAIVICFDEQWDPDERNSTDRDKFQSICELQLHCTLQVVFDNKITEWTVLWIAYRECTLAGGPKH